MSKAAMACGVDEQMPDGPSGNTKCTGGLAAAVHVAGLAMLVRELRGVGLTCLQGDMADKLQNTLESERSA